MKAAIWKTSVLLLSLVICSSSFASEATEAQTGFRLTPRLWLATIDLQDDEETSTEAYSLPMYGLTASVTPKATPNLNFMLTGLHGEGDGELVSLWGDGDTEGKRTDIEFLVRYNFPGKNFSIFAGPRYVAFDKEDIVGSWRAETDTTIWVIEVGAGTVTPISDDGRHRFFGNFTFGVAFSDYDYEDTDGWDESESDTKPSIDFNFGYQYSIGASSSFSIRYRSFLLMEENDFEQLKHSLVHGPEAAFTINF
jgi:hypothetical protein